MAEVSTIEWTHATFNPWRGCVHATLPDGTPHPGCKSCYAEAMSKRNPAALGRWGLPMAEGGEGMRVRGTDSYWRQPLRWNREAEKAGERRRVFCASLADVFEEWDGPILDAKGEQLYFPFNSWEERRPYIPASECGDDEKPVTMADLRRDLFALIDATPHLDWLLLTKRPQNVRKMWPDGIPGDGKPKHEALVGTKWRRKNVWLGTSISDQHSADQLVPLLLQCRDLCPVLFLSAEPLVGPIDITPWMFSSDGFVSTPEEGPRHRDDGGKAVDWVIVGGESGHHARPFDLAWARSLRGQCKAAGVPCFIKQLGAVTVDSSLSEADGTPGILLGLKDKKGGDWSEWPSDLRVREFPEVAHA